MEIDLQQIACRPSIGVRRIHETPLIAASAQSLTGYGRLVDNPREFPIEIVPWPAQGWRAIDENTGLFAWSTWPEEAVAEPPAKPRERAHLARQLSPGRRATLPSAPGTELRRAAR